MSATEFNFMSLSPQIHSQILSYLSMKDIYKGIACTSKRMNELCKKSHVWRGRYLKLKFENWCMPGPLLCHSAVMCKDEDGNSQMMCYGGNLSSTNIIENVKNDMWCYVFAIKKWVKSTAQSIPLTEHTSVAYKNTMFIFGGNGGLVDNYSNVVLTYPLPYMPGHKITTHDSLPGAPQPRSAHTAVVYKNEMYIFGGWNGYESLNDFYSLNLDTLQWRQINSADAPSKRRMHSAVVHKDKMYIFGGYDESRLAQTFNELYCFDFQTETWKIVPCKGKIPIGRSRAGAAIVGNNMYIVGGWDRLSHFGEVLRFDLETYTWFQEKTDLNRKLAQQSCVVMDDSWLVMYGGKNETEDKELLASTDLIVTRLSALPSAPYQHFEKKFQKPTQTPSLVTPSIASIHS